MPNAEFRVLSPTAILGYGFPEESFMAGVARRPHLIACDAGSTDPGPYYLGSGKSFTNRAFVKRDLRYMLVEGLKLGVPVVVGSAGGSGAAPHLAWCRGILEEIAREEELSFRLGAIAADIDKAAAKAALRVGKIRPMPFAPELTEEAIDASCHLVAQMGGEPLVKAFQAGCNVILAGRCYDPANFAALPIALGYDPGLAIHLGKILECGAIAASPGSGADCAFGTLTGESFILEALSPARNFTRESAAAHTLYEKSDPYRLPGPGGVLHLENCSFAELGDGRVEVRGSRHENTSPYRVKLEGARKAGFRAVSIAGSRDPIFIAKIDEILHAVRAQVSTMMQNTVPGSIIFHVYGKDAVMGPTEPEKVNHSHEIGIVIEAVAPTPEAADTLLSVTRSTLLHYGYPGRISTAGNLAFPFSPSDIAVGDVYEFSVYHLMEIERPDDFPLQIVNFKRGRIES
ncbi:MAG: acyclic terpene utilization AtuA family protein [Pirellulales bacterium]|nr:acyclic terpene utilization AtuA family protein [Pirellulales bacterium]